MRIIEEHSFVEGLPIFQIAKQKLLLYVRLFDEESINSNLVVWGYNWTNVILGQA